MKLVLVLDIIIIQEYYQMCKPAFLVDGHTEQKIVQRLVPDSPVQLINCNGDDVQLDAIVKRLLTLIKLLNNRFYPIIIIMDREDRAISCKDMINKIFKLLKDKKNEQYVIGISDRMIENWMLADWENFLRYIGRVGEIPYKNYEGECGKTILKKLYPPYHETIDGVEIFLKSNKNEIIRNSKSFESFTESLKKLNCEQFEEIFK